MSNFMITLSHVRSTSCFLYVVFICHYGIFIWKFKSRLFHFTLEVQEDLQINHGRLILIFISNLVLLANRKKLKDNRFK